MDERNMPIGELNQYLYTHWENDLKNALSSTLGISTAFIRHNMQRRIEVDGEDVYYTFEIVAGDDVDSAEAYVFTVKLNFHNDMFGLVQVCTRAEYDPKNIKRYGVLADQHLIPRLHNNNLREKEAERFLKHFCPEALEAPMPVPILKIMEEQMGLRVENEYCIPGKNTYGFTVYENQLFTMTDDDGKEVTPYYLRGTVVVDSDTALLYGIGMMNFTLAHEAYHWFAHRACADFHKLVGEQGASSYNGTSRYSAADILEIQSNAMASRILLPKRPFIQKFRELSNGEKRPARGHCGSILFLQGFLYGSNVPDIRAWSCRFWQTGTDRQCYSDGCMEAL